MEHHLTFGLGNMAPSSEGGLARLLSCITGLVEQREWHSRAGSMASQMKWSSAACVMSL